jgi:hypothetical protein
MTQTIKPSTAASSPAGHGVDRSNSTPLRPDLPLARRGRLKNGNPSGDFLAAPRCGAHTRCGGSCRQPAMANGRCRLHGGLSTGPRTPAGLARSRRARWKHGARSADVAALRRAARAQLGRTRVLLARTHISAGHGVDRSISPATPRPSRTKMNRRDAEAPRGHVSGTGRASTATANVLRERSSRHHSIPNGVARQNISDSASLRLCVSAVPLPSSAWHGVHRSISQPEPRRSSAFICGQTALPPLGMGSIAQIRKLGRPPLPEHRASTVWVHPRPSAACATCRQLGMGFFARFFIAPRCTAAPSDL